MIDEEKDELLQLFLDEHPEIKQIFFSLGSERLREIYAAEILQMLEVLEEEETQQ